MTTNRVYPGMVNEEIEFFVNNDTVKALQNGRVLSFTELSFTVIQMLREKIEIDDLVNNALMEMHPYSELKRVEQFAKCRFGGLDFEADIKNGCLQDGEYWNCPLRGKCKHEGVLCKLPIFEGNRLSKTDVDLIRMSTTDKTNEVIAEELNMPLGTFHKYKRILYEKLGVQTKQEVALLAMILNII